MAQELEQGAGLGAGTDVKQELGGIAPPATATATPRCRSRTVGGAMSHAPGDSPAPRCRSRSVLQYACFDMRAPICVLQHACSDMRAVTCELCYACRDMRAVLCVLRRGNPWISTPL